MNQDKRILGSKKYTIKSYVFGILVIVALLIFTSVGVHASENNSYIKIEGNNYQGDTKWNYDYTGSNQTFAVSVSGTYHFEVYGAQGAGYESFSGGYGGSVTGTVNLNKGDILRVIVGGTNGYNGGGEGTLSNGGGATQIDRNGSLLVIAGGGGGATNVADGNAGGSTAGTNGNFLDGSDSTEINSAGGGGGYVGGNSGYTKYHSHVGNESDGGQCYSTPIYHAHEGDSKDGSGCYSIPIYHVHVGESAYYGGCYTNVNYHVHQGNSSEMGACYTIPKYHSHVGNKIDGGSCYATAVMHEHTSSCPSKTCTSTSFTPEQIGTISGMQTVYVCNSCGMGYSQSKSVCGNINSTCKKGNTVEYYNLTCSKNEADIIGYDVGCGMLTTTPESYSLACEKNEESIDSYEIGCNNDVTTIIGYQLSCEKIENETIDDSKAGFGGSNYCDSSICTNVKSNAGANAGNGNVTLTLIAVDGATLSYYSDNTSLLKKVTVAKGETVVYPFTENPQKSADEKYSYTFAGWDDMNTEVIEKYSNHETIQNTSSSHNYRAVYDVMGQNYTITFDSQGADILGTQNVSVTYGQPMSEIEIPTRNNHIFAGYFSQPQGLGTQYYNSAGIAINNSNITTNTVLYAYWIQPISISKQPIDVYLTTGYRGAVIELDTMLTSSGDFSIQYHWYQKNINNIDDVTPIAVGTGKNFILPENYGIGEYAFFCKITVTDNTNQHDYTLHSNTVVVQIMKGKISEKQIECKENSTVYDGKYHSVLINVDIPSEYSIYYSLEPLTAENYMSQGQKLPISLINAGDYKVHYYITSSDYEDYYGKINFSIQKATPEIIVLSKNGSYTGKALHVDGATVVGVNDAILSNINVTYIYYIDAECTQKTSEENGATEAGAAPSKVGSYYVMVYVDETENYAATCTSTPALLNILRTTVDFEVKGYTGIYDKAEHGVIADAKNNENVTFYYSTENTLTANNYATEGKTNSPVFINAGSYKVYYIVVNKLTGKLNTYILGDVTITIYKAQQHITYENQPRFNTNTRKVIFPEGGNWEYKKGDSNVDWQEYTNETLSVGVYEFRLMENENYYASESVIIRVTSNENSGGNGQDNATDKTDEEEVAPDSKPVPTPEHTPDLPDIEEEQRETPSADKEASKGHIDNDESSDIQDDSMDNIETDTEDSNHNGIPDSYEQDRNGNGIPDIYETDNNGNGIPDYFEWDMNENGIADYLEDENKNGIPDFLEWQNPVKQLKEDEENFVEIEEAITPLDSRPKQTLPEKIMQTVKDIVSEENAKIVLPCVTAGMVIGLFASYLVLVLLSPFIKLKTKYRYYIETLLSGKAQKYKISINTDLAKIDSSRAAEGIHFFRQLCTNEDYILTIKDKNNYSIGIIKITFMKKRVFHEVIINQGVEIQVEQLKHGARLHIR